MINIGCRDHPTYQGKRQPAESKHCYTCWFIWRLRNQEEIPPYRFKVAGRDA